MLGLLRLCEGQTLAEGHLAAEGRSRFGPALVCPDLPITHLLSPNYMLDKVVQTQDAAPLWLILVLNMFFDNLKAERRKARRKERASPHGTYIREWRP